MVANASWLGALRLTASEGPLGLLRVGIVLLCAIPVALLIARSGALPHWDYWLSLPLDLSEGWFRAEVKGWLQPFNEHYLIVPQMIYSWNRWLSGGNNMILGTIAATAALVQALMLLRLARHEPKRDPILALLFAVVVGVACFTPNAIHNWISGMSGVAWIPANMFSVLAIGLLCESEERSRAWLFGAIVCASLGSITYSTGMAVWPALVFAAFALPLRGDRRLTVLLCAALAVAIYFWAYQRPGHHPDLQASPVLIVAYVLAFLGSAWIPEKTLVVGGGVAALIFAGAASLVFWARQGSRAAVPWIMLLMFTGGTAVMAALSRSGYGISQAMTSRYASLPALFACATIFVVIAAVQTFELSSRFARAKVLAGASALIIGFVAVTYVKGHARVPGQLNRVVRKQLAGVALVTGAGEKTVLEKRLSPHFRSATWATPAVATMKQISHLPFRPSFLPCPALGEVLEGVEEKSEVRGYVDRIRPVAGGVAVEGWWFSPAAASGCIVLANEALRVTGYAIAGFERKDVEKSIGRPARRAGWMGFATIEPGEQGVVVAVSGGPEGPWLRLAGRPGLESP